MESNMFNKIKKWERISAGLEYIYIYPIYKGTGTMSNQETTWGFPFCQYVAKYFQESWLVD
jgi:hypothetical protein